VKRAEVIERLKDHIDAYYNGLQVEMAYSIGVDKATLNKVIKGKLPVPKIILEDMGMRKTESYEYD